jgi:hypothetical protein
MWKESKKQMPTVLRQKEEGVPIKPNESMKAFSIFFKIKYRSIMQIKIIFKTIQKFRGAT